MQSSESTQELQLSPVMPPKDTGGAGVEPRAARAQGVHSSALPWAPAGWSQARVRTNHSHTSGTGPVFRALSQHLKLGKGEIGSI